MVAHPFSMTQEFILPIAKRTPVIDHVNAARAGVAEDRSLRGTSSGIYLGSGISITFGERDRLSRAEWKHYVLGQSIVCTT